jgi:hypothetical protein
MGKRLSANLSLGQRVNLDALALVKHTAYKKEEGKIYGKKTLYTHRYAFRSRDGDNFVYSGICLHLVIGHTYNIRATVKRFEPQYDCIRLSRVAVVGGWEEERYLL